MEQTTIVSRNVPVMDTNPCRTHDFVCAAAAAMGAEPSPASLEKMPRAIPFCMATMMAPSAPPAAAWTPKAPRRIFPTAAGTAPRLQKMSSSDSVTYSTTISGMTFAETRAMRLSPPMTTSPTQHASRAEPTTVVQL